MQLTLSYSDRWMGWKNAGKVFPEFGECLAVVRDELTKSVDVIPLKFVELWDPSWPDRPHRQAWRAKVIEYCIDRASNPTRLERFCDTHYNKLPQWLIKYLSKRIAI